MVKVLDIGPSASLREIEHGNLTHASGRCVPYKIIHGWDWKTSLMCDNLWKADFLKLLQQIEIAEPDEAKQYEILSSISTEDSHWNWFAKSVSLHSEEYEWFHIYAENKPQAACVIYHPNESALGPGNIFYIKYVAVAPWNRPCALRPREFQGLGKIILRAAQCFAVLNLHLRPGFCLHSLPRAEGFYIELNMVKVIGREDEQSLSYFELPQTCADELMRGNVT